MFTAAVSAIAAHLVVVRGEEAPFAPAAAAGDAFPAPAVPDVGELVLGILLIWHDMARHKTHVNVKDQSESKRWRAIHKLRGRHNCFSSPYGR